MQCLSISKLCSVYLSSSSQIVREKKERDRESNRKKNVLICAAVFVSCILFCISAGI